MTRLRRRRAKRKLKAAFARITAAWFRRGIFLILAPEPGMSSRYSAAFIRRQVRAAYLNEVPEWRRTWLAYGGNFLSPPRYERFLRVTDEMFERARTPRS